MNATLKLLPALIFSFPLLAADPARDLNTPRGFPEIRGRAEWKERAAEIREHVQFACGLWPLPPKTPLNERIFGRVERDGYSVEKVYFETYPGFFLAGNLYRPLGKGTGPFPAILNPHGHWPQGRMADEELGSIAARCISFARQGMVAFSYDMVGYNDTVQVDHKFGSDRANLLWNISLMGLQTWNSIRALDFLESLPDVDKKRLACTGESGGGTQTFILGAIDDRLAALAPIVMVSHSMQGGCLCENAPGLRVDYSNMEIAAAPAPLPQIIVGATGDWTRKTMQIEGPAIEKIYALFRGQEHFDYAIFDYAHNYNKTSREAVYASFGKWLLNEKNPLKLKELPYKKEPDAALRVFPESDLPGHALREADLISSMVRIFAQQINENKPANSQSLKRWKEIMFPAWEHALHLQHVRATTPETNGETVTIRRQPDDARVSFTIQEPVSSRTPQRLFVLRIGRPMDNSSADSLRAQGVSTVTLEMALPENDQFTNYFHTYNRTYAQNTVANVKVVCTYLRERFPRSKVVLLGQHELGPTMLLAAPLADGLVVDCVAMDETKDADLLSVNVFFPGIRRLGSFQGMAALAAPKPLFIHNFKQLDTGWLPALYQGKASGTFRQQNERASENEVTEWIARLAAN